MEAVTPSAPPAERGLRILHLSDTHLFGDETLHYGSVDTLAALDRVLARQSAEHAQSPSYSKTEQA